MARCNRRTALRTLAAGAAAAASSAWVESLSALAVQHAHSPQSAVTAQNWTPRVLDARQNETVIALTELIIPETDTAGAKAAGVNRFIDAVLQKAKPEDRDSFVRGLTWVDDRSRRQFKNDFVAATPAQQTALLTELSERSRSPDVPAELRTGADFFRAIKSLTIDGYYTTEVGLRQELGDNGQLFLAQFAGCDHPEHQP